MLAFADRTDSDRMALRDIVENAGGIVEGYYGECLQVAIPAPSGPFFAAIRPHFELSNLFYFPLGSDDPPHVMRHDGRYPGSRGFWFYANLKPRGNLLA